MREIRRMRTPPKRVGDLTARAVAGTHGVLFGFDVADGARAGLLGFAIERTDVVTGDRAFLPNFLRFEANDHPDGPTGTDRNPLQAFQWGDYTPVPGQRLRYAVQSMYGTSDAPVARDQVTLDVVCEPADDGHHGVYFNRGVAGSQAYTRKFGDHSPVDLPEAQRWMSRGLEEGLIAFIERAQGPGWGLHGAFYEFFHLPVLRALHAATRRGVDVKLAVACPSVADWPDYPAWHNIEAIHECPGSRGPPAYKGLSRFVEPRRHSRDIPHNKFLVLVDPANGPVAVWTGSTNITPGALWGHSNVGHLVTDQKVAAAFLDYGRRLFDDEPGDDLVEVNETATPLNAIASPGTTPLFSPRRDRAALAYYASLLNPHQAAFITGPFGFAKELTDALAVDRDVPRYVLLESRGDATDVGKGDPDVQVTAGAFLGRPGGWRQFLQEHLTGLNDHVKYVHTKYLLVDPLTEDPTLVTGSANFSPNSTLQNDENMLVIRGDTRVADIYLTEFMRLFTHLRFRFDVVGGDPEKRSPDPHEPAVKAHKHLAPDGSWADDYFKPDSPKVRERKLFSSAT
jgi:phosphatidylserine/phosphatidylglycerophosphate/cardiolipin synthase-like enzyme